MKKGQTNSNRKKSGGLEFIFASLTQPWIFYVMYLENRMTKRIERIKWGEQNVLISAMKNSCETAFVFRIMMNASEKRAYDSFAPKSSETLHPKIANDRRKLWNRNGELLLCNLVALFDQLKHFLCAISFTRSQFVAFSHPFVNRFNCVEMGTPVKVILSNRNCNLDESKWRFSLRYALSNGRLTLKN